MSLRYLLYTRLSTDDEKQALSIPAQERELHEKFGDLDIVEVIKEEESAYKPRTRTKFYEMLGRIEKGEADGIIAWHPDRLSRNAIDAAEIIDALDRKVLIDMKFGSYLFINSPEGKQMLQMTLSQSKYQSEKLGVDVKRGMREKCVQGYPPGGKAPNGYKFIVTNPEERDRRTIMVKDLERFDLVREAWDMLLSGMHSVPKIADTMHKKRGLTIPATRNIPEKPITASSLYKIFSNLTYTGEFEWDGTIYGDLENPKYPAMISLQEFDSAQEILGRKGKPRLSANNMSRPLTGIIKCGHCKGCYISCDSKRKKLINGREVQYSYFKCSRKGRGCPGKQITKAELTRQLREYVESISISPRLLEWIRSQLLVVSEKDRDQQRKNIKGWLRNYDKCDEAIQGLISMFSSTDNLDESLLTKEEFKDQKLKLMKDRMHYKKLMDDHERNVDSAINRTIQTFEFSTNALKAFDKGDADTQRMVLTTFSANWTMKDGVVLCEPRFPFKRIGEAISATAAKKTRRELQKVGSTEPKRGLSKSESLKWYPGEDSNL